MKVDFLPTWHYSVMNYIVREYIPGPVKCFNCQMFGHVATRCMEKCICARCGGNHEYGKCEEGVQPKCCNCREAHSAAFRGFEVLNMEMDIQKRWVENKITYAEQQNKLNDKLQIKEVSQGFQLKEKMKFQKK